MLIGPDRSFIEHDTGSQAAPESVSLDSDATPSPSIQSDDGSSGYIPSPPPSVPVPAPVEPPPSPSSVSPEVLKGQFLPPTEPQSPPTLPKPEEPSTSDKQDSSTLSKPVSTSKEHGGGSEGYRDSEEVSSLPALPVLVEASVYGPKTKLEVQHSDYVAFVSENPELKTVFSFEDYLAYMANLEADDSGEGFGFEMLNTDEQFSLDKVGSTNSTLAIDPIPSIEIDEEAYAAMIETIYERALQAQSMIDEGTLDDLEGFQVVLMTAAREAGNDSELFLQLVNEVVLGGNNKAKSLEQQFVFGETSGDREPIGFGGDGLWSGYRDGYRNQLSGHYWAYVNIAHNYGTAASNAANFLHENNTQAVFYREELPFPGHSEEDYRLGVIGTRMGALLSDGTWTPEDFALHFEDVLSTGTFDSTPDWAMDLGMLQPSIYGPNSNGGQYHPPYGFPELFSDIHGVLSLAWERGSEVVGSWFDG